MSVDETSSLEVKGLSKTYANSEDGAVGGIREAGFALKSGTFFTLLGPSGCGKTTTLRCIAGLEQPDLGEIRLGTDVMFDAARGINVPLNRRNIGMVFQSYAIWPHMSVFENVAFPLRVSSERKFSGADIKTMVGEALRRVGLDGLEGRSSTRLSGGQQQRVALARAIVRRPRLLLLDEPLSNLDATLRDEMRTELKRLQQEVGITTVYVTHDQSEALEMSDLVAVIDKGRIAQMGTPRDIYFQPSNIFVAGFVGTTNLLPATAIRDAAPGTLASVVFDGQHEIACLTRQNVRRGEPIVVSIRPESISLAAPGTPPQPDASRLTGTVASIGFLGQTVRYGIRVGSKTLQVNTFPDKTFANGGSVTLDFKPEAAIGLPPDAQRSTPSLPAA